MNDIRIVLSHTSHPGNVGAAARAMKTMGLTELVLVNPRDYPSAEATARASGADDLLASARLVDSFQDAIADCHLVLGTSARLRSVPMPQLDPRQAATRAIATRDQGHRVALVFGRERTGLSNDEIDRCGALVNIPANPEYSSLNLASAVQVLCYELRMAAIESGAVPAARMSDHEPAPAGWLEGYFQHLEETLLAVEFLDPRQQATMMTRLRRLFMRAEPSENEIHILRGMLSAIQKATAAGETKK